MVQRRREGARQGVGDRQQVVGEAIDGVEARFGGLPLGAATKRVDVEVSLLHNAEAPTSG